MPSPELVTKMLDLAAAGDPLASEKLLPLVYAELRQLARQKLSHEAAGLTLQPTALVHEAYLRLLGASLEDGGSVSWNSRGHFFAAAAHAMRRILIERARRVRAAKHGGGVQHLDLDHLDRAEGPLSHTISIDEQHMKLVQLDDALQRLERLDSRKTDIVMLRFFAGLSIDQTAAAMGLSAATVKNEWRFARAWLHSDMEQPHGDGHGSHH